MTRNELHIGGGIFEWFSKHPEVNDDDTPLMHELAIEAFEELKNDILQSSNAEPNPWNILVLLLDRYRERLDGEIDLKINNGGFEIVIEHNSHNGFDSMFAKELLSILFQRMPAVKKADISIMSDDAIKVCVYTVVNNESRLCRAPITFCSTCNADYCTCRPS
jgi:hypothetical protein